MHHRHATGYNALNSVLYLGPRAVFVTPEDKKDLGAFATRMELEFNLYMPAKTSFRQLCFLSTHLHAAALRRAPESQAISVMSPSKAQNRRRRREPSGERAGRKRRRR